MISKIQDASEDNNFPLLKALVTDYLKVWKQSLAIAKDSDDDEEKDEDEDKGDNEKGDDDDDNDDDQGPSRKEHAIGKDQDDDSEREESPPHQEDDGFNREVRKHPIGKGDSSKGRQHVDASPRLVAVLQDMEQCHLWKNMAMRQMFGKWHLQVKLAKMAAYLEKRFATSPAPPPAVPAKYPPTDEGMVQLVLAPTMQRIKAILSEKVGALLT